MAACIVVGIFGLNCTKPKILQCYSRTPDGIGTAKSLPLGRPLRVGLSVDLPNPVRPAKSNDSNFDPMLTQRAAYQIARSTTEAFIHHATDSGKFESVDWVHPETMQALDCELEISVGLESSGAAGVRYCLGHLVANIYNHDHSELLDRVFLFHEAMYTPKGGKLLHLAYDGSDVYAMVQAALFDQLVDYVVGVPQSGS